MDGGGDLVFDRCHKPKFTKRVILDRRALIFGLLRFGPKGEV